MLAIITGGTRGIGLGITKKLLEIGYVCLVTARTISDDIKQMIDQGKAVHFVSADISLEQDRKKIVSKAKELGAIMLLVNNAGVAPKVRKDMLEIGEDEFDYVMDINLKGTYFLTQDIANIMKERCEGRIINISSMSSYTSSTMRAEYCISKAGISMITKLFADRMAEFNIGVFEIAPGIIMTDMTEGVKEKYAKLINEGVTPIKRFGYPEDIANCVESIAVGKMDFCTGNVFNCDGGFSVRRL